MHSENSSFSILTTAIIITLCSLLLIAYLFDLTFAKTKIPSVILLLLLGWVVRQIADFLRIDSSGLAAVLPILGTIGLILIVLEGTLEVELNKSKLKLVRVTFVGALIVMFALAFCFAFLFMHFGGYSLKNGLINAIPFCIISSAIAIPSVRNLSSENQEFIIYESSLSDILGVIFFNFIALNGVIGLDTFGHFGLQILIMMVVAFVATMGLSLLLSKIEHHIKFAPIILLIILIYTVSEVYHLPALIFILLFGLFIGNLDELRSIKWIERLRPDLLNKEVMKFKELTGEAAFLIRALFFLLFGFLLETREILNSETLIWSSQIVMLIFLVRAVHLRIAKKPLMPLLFVAPRGLITILLFLSIKPIHQIELVNKSLIIQVIILTALIMMVGLMATTRPENED